MHTVFDTPDYVQARENRLRNVFQHVAPWSLIGSRILEVGCGTGELGEEFVKLGCQVTSIDANPSHVQELRHRFPDRDAHVGSAVDGLICSHTQNNQPFDIVLCFGMLYHLPNPASFLSNCSAIAPMLYLETVVSDFTGPACPLIQEQGPDQSSTGIGCRPSAIWLERILRTLHYAVQDISSPVANWETAVFDWTPQNDGAWIRNGKTLRKMYICTQEHHV